jgi:predicted TIM-barrel fold metal-dependent hydrolase
MTQPPVKLLSCDTHLEHWPTVLTDYVPAECRDLLETAPSLMVLWGGVPVFGKECIPVNMMGGIGRFSEIAPGRFDISTQEIPGAYGGPKEYLGWLDLDGCDAAVLVPGIAIGACMGAAKGTGDRDAYLGFIRGYNNWVSDFCSENPERLLGCAAVPGTSVDDAIEELRRVRDLPAIRTVGPSNFPNGTTTPDLDDDRYWAATLDLDMPITLHGGISSPVQGLRTPWDAAAWIMGQVECTTGGPYSAVQLILSGVFDRFPDLRFIILECGAGWLPYMMGELNHMYSRHKYWAGINVEQPPSWYCTSGNILWNLIADRTAIKLRDEIGVANLSMATDFPHSNSQYPWSKVRAMELTDGIPAQERHEIMWQNAAKYYRLED